MIFSCALCPDQDNRWEQDLPAATGQRLLDAHQQRHHADVVAPPADEAPKAPQPVPQLVGVDWWTKAIDGIARLARESMRTGHPFTVFEVTNFGVEEPPNPRADWGKLTRDAEHMELIAHAVDGNGRQLTAKSKRPTGNSSLVFQWVAGPAITGRPAARRSDTA